MDDSAIMPGGPVRASDGAFGSIERVVTDAGGIELESLLVRRDSDGTRYRVPATQIGALRTERGQDMVHLIGSSDELEQFRIHDGTVLDDELDDELAHAPAPPYQGGGLLERLQAGFDSLTSGVREALEGGSVSRPAHDPDEVTEALRVPVVEEQIVTRTESVRTGTLRVRKSVETAQESVMVTVSHEEPDVEYISVEDYDPKAPYHPGETFIPIMGERLVVEKRQVVTGYLRVRKRTVSEQQEVTETLRRERVTVEEQPHARVQE